MFKKKNIFFLLILIFCLMFVPNVNASSIEVDTLEELISALNNSNYDEIVLTQTINITTDTTLEGHNKLLKATSQGVNEQGIIQNAPMYSMFIINSGTKLSITNMHIKGAGTSAFEVKTNGVLELENVSVSNTGSSYYSAGAIANYGTTYLKNVSLRHNVAKYAGAILNSGKLVIDGAVIYENRNIASGSFGGGALENQGTAYINNAIFANNYSTEIGGAINNYMGTLYIINSTFTGNATESSQPSFGGAIGYNNGEITIINSILNNNYNINNGVLTPSDFGKYSGEDAYIYHSIVGSVVYSNIEFGVTLTNVKNVSENVFHKTIPGHLVSNANEIVTYEEYVRPNIIVSGYSANVYSKLNGEASTGGVYTFFNYDKETKNVTLCYGDTKNASFATCLVGDNTMANHLVNKFSDGSERSSLVIGSSDASEADYYTLTIAYAENGYVLNENIFGTSYLKNSTVNLETVADLGYFFQYWEYKDGDIWKKYSENANLKVKMNKDYILRPVFATNPKYVVTFDSSIENTITSQLDNYEEGSTVLLEYNGDYVVKILKTSDETDVTSLVSYNETTKTFIMPAYDVLVTASKKKYGVSVDSSFSSFITIEKNEYEANSVVKINYDNSKYIVQILKANSLEDITTKVKYNETTKTFIMPDYDVLITASRIGEAVNPDTYDGVLYYFIINIISVIGVFISGLWIKKGFLR